jgi:predicted RNase H-like nuclease (RuvC/YqgF family)
MASEERFRELVKMLLELRMASTPGEAERRAAAIIASTDGQGPSLSTVAEPESAPEDHSIVNETPERADVKEPQTVRSINTIDEMKRELSGLNPVPKAPTPEPVSVVTPAEPEPKELDQANEDLSSLKEDEAKEEGNARELEEQMLNLKRELDNSRKEVEMLRNKLTKTEEALANAQQSVQKTDRELAQPQPRAPVPNHEKPRGTNPAVDLSKIFGKK